MHLLIYIRNQNSLNTQKNETVSFWRSHCFVFYLYWEAKMLKTNENKRAKNVILIFLVFGLAACNAPQTGVSDLKFGMSFGDARKVAYQNSDKFECMEMDHPEERRMTLECISRYEDDKEHYCYSFVEKNGIYLLDKKGCQNTN